MNEITFDELKNDIILVRQLLNGLKTTSICNSSTIDRCDIAKAQHMVTLTENEKMHMLNNGSLIDKILEEKQLIIDRLELRDDIHGVYNTKGGIDDRQEIKEVATKFIYTNMLTNTAVLKILHCVQTLWEINITKYIEVFNKENDTDVKNDDIKLLYRGGNTLISILEELLKTTPPLLFKQLTETFKNIMTKSDIDFTIFINPIKYPKGEIFDKLFNDISILTLGIVFRVRLLILTKNLNIFKRLTTSSLKQFLNNLNSMECVKNVPENTSPFKGFQFVRIVYNDVYYETQNLDDVPLNYEINKYNSGVFNDVAGSSHTDLQILSTDTGYITQDLLFWLRFSEYPQEKSSIYATYNDNNYYKNNRFVQRYSLSRLKINFRVYYIHDGKLSVTNIPGELIDLSVTNNDVGNEDHVVVETTQLDLIEKWNNTQLYKFIKHNSNDEIKIYSFSLKYYFVDICNMLFLVSKYPWENKKYTKLLKRVFLLCMVNLLSHTQENGYIESPNNTSIVQFMEFISQSNSYEVKSEYISVVNKELYYYQLMQIILQLNVDVTNSDDETAKLYLKHFNDDISQILLLNNGIIVASFSQPKTNNIIDDNVTNIVL